MIIDLQKTDKLKNFKTLCERREGNEKNLVFILMENFSFKFQS